jgi:hypothetical protein
MPATRKPRPTDARHRRVVRMPDGRVGILLYIHPHSKVAKVQVGSRHERIDRNLLSIPTTHLLVFMGDDEWTGCCGVPVEDINPHDVMVANPEVVSCARMV